MISSNVLPKGATFKEVDHMLVFNFAHSTVGQYYDRISFDGLRIPLGQMDDAHTKRLAIFSGIEVKKDPKTRKLERNWRPGWWQASAGSEHWKRWRVWPPKIWSHCSVGRPWAMCEHYISLTRTSTIEQ